MESAISLETALPDGVIVGGRSCCGAAMSSYRIYLVGDRAIRGRHDFDAERDQNATQITYGLLDACPDACQSFDLWQGTWRVAVPRLVVPTTFDKLSAANQERVFNTEETIVFNE